MRAPYGFTAGKNAVTGASRKRPAAGHDTTMNASLTRTHYVNVDLDVFARVPLDELADAIGPKVFVLCRKMWKEASSREFNIPIESGFAPHGFGLRLAQIRSRPSKDPVSASNTRPDLRIACVD